MRVAVIGTGNIANTHASALLNEKQALTLAVGTSLDKAKGFAAKWGFASYSDCFEDALSEGIDCIHITTPPPFHYEMALKAIRAGKHVVCEKPLSLEKWQAEELYKAAEMAGTVCAVNYNVRFHDAVQRARTLVGSGALGDALYITGSYFQSFGIMPTAYSWRFQPEIGGNMRCVTEIGSHWFDLIRFITGLEITEVAADFGYVFPQRTVRDGMLYPEGTVGEETMLCTSEDSATIMLRFSNGAKGVLALSQLAHGRSNRIAYELHGSSSSLWWDSEDPLKLHQAEHGKGICTTVNAFAGAFPDTHAEFFHQVYDMIAAGERTRPGVPSFRDGYLSTAVCTAVWESATHGSCWTKVVE